MNTEKKFGFATRQIHAGHMENAAGSLCAPIYQTSTFAFSTVQQGGARFAGEEGGYIYTRLGNPTLGAVEEKLASLEGGEARMAAPPAWAPSPPLCGPLWWPGTRSWRMRRCTAVHTRC